MCMISFIDFNIKGPGGAGGVPGGGAGGVPFLPGYGCKQASTTFELINDERII